MYFNRFDVCLAWYLYAVHWHGGQFTEDYKILGRLSDMGYRPSHDEEYKDVLASEGYENAKEIYLNLVFDRQGLSALRQEFRELANVG